MIDKFYGEADILIAFQDSEVTIKVETSDAFPCIFSQRDVEDSYQNLGGHMERYTTVLMRRADYLTSGAIFGSACIVAETNYTIISAKQIQDGAVMRVLLREA